MSATRVPVLMYHRVGVPDHPRHDVYCVHPRRFARHMERLAELGMRACGIDAFSDWLAGRAELPEGSLLITFDDGYLDLYAHALPVLARLGWPASVFLVTGKLGSSSDWNTSPKPRSHALLGPEEVKSMQREGFSFHSHSRMHRDLTTLSDEELAADLNGSRQDLAELLGAPPRHLAYPFGRHDARVVAATRAAGFDGAFSVRSGFNRVGEDALRIRRIDVLGTDTPAMLARKVRLGTNDGSLLNQLRYYGARLRDRLARAAA